MALSYTGQVSQAAQESFEICQELKALVSRINQFLETNQDLQIDWLGDPLPPYINEDSDGNLDGFNFTRQELSNSFASMQQYLNLMTNLAVAQGDWLGNVNKVTDVAPQTST